MDKTISSKLGELGLSEKESILYLELLKFSSASAQQLALSSSLNRSTVYVLLDELVKKGFAKEEKPADKRIYSAETPEILIKKADDFVKYSEAVRNDMISITEQLNQLQTAHQGVPYSTFFENKEGLSALKQEVASAAKKLSMCGCVKTTLTKALLENAKDLRLIVNKKTVTQFPKVLENVQLISLQEHPFTSDFFVFGNKIILISDEEEFAVRIESTEFAEVLRETFNLAWEEAGRLQ